MSTSLLARFATEAGVTSDLLLADFAALAALLVFLVTAFLATFFFVTFEDLAFLAVFLEADFLLFAALAVTFLELFLPEVFDLLVFFFATGNLRDSYHAARR